MINFFMLGSFLLGLIALLLSGVNIVKFRINHNNNWGIYSIVRITVCAIAVGFQVIYSNRIIQVGDWSVLMNTSGTSTLLSIVLLISTFVLNGVSLGMYFVKNK